LTETLDRSRERVPARALWRELNWRSAGRFIVIGAIYATVVNLLGVGPLIARHAGEEHLLDEVQLNLLLAAGNGAAILAALMGGWLTDRLGHRRAMGLGLAVQATGILTWSLLPPSPLSIGFFVVSSAGWVVAHIAYGALLTGVTEGRARGTFVGVVGMLTGLLGSPAGRVGAGLRSLNSSGPFWAALLLSLLLAAVLALDARLSNRERTSLS
jgi:MFS family permease